MISTDEFVRTLDWNLLRIFHEIAQARGISKASDQTRLKQSALSLALQRLEAKLGVTLCDRGAKGFELTREGTLLAELCAPIMRAVREIPSISETSSSEIHGQLTLGIISNFTDRTFDQAIATFHERFPQVEILISTLSWSSISGAILRSEIDIGVGPAAMRHPDLRYRFLAPELHLPYCGVRHPLFGRQVDDPRQLHEEAFILTGSDEPDELRAFRLRHGLGARPSAVTDHLEEAKRLAMLGTGLVFLPASYAAADHTAGRLWPLLAKPDAPAIDVYLIDNPGSSQLARRNRLRQGFLDCVVEMRQSDERGAP